METGYTVKESKHTSLLEDGFMPVETALEVPVQEQHKVIVGFDEVMLNAKLITINRLKKELAQEIKSLPSTIKIQIHQDC